MSTSYYCELRIEVFSGKLEQVGRWSKKHYTAIRKHYTAIKLFWYFGQAIIKYLSM